MSLDRAWTAAFAPPDRRPLPEWAADQLTLPPVLTKSGRPDFSGSRQLIAPMLALQSDTCRKVFVCAPVRGGKTLIVDVAVPWAITQDQASVLWIFQNDELAKEHAELRAMPILETTPSVAPLMPSNRHHKRTQEIIFNNGLPFIIQGPALGGLQSKGFKWVILDEPWMYERGVMGEAEARLGDFVKIAAEKLVAISQGGDEDSDWAQYFATGVLYLWNVPCAACGRMFYPTWSGFREDQTRWGMCFATEKLPDGGYDLDRAKVGIEFECPHCRHRHPNTEATRAAWNRGGRYLLEDGREPPAQWPERVSFRWPAMIDFPWAVLVEEWLIAQKAKHAGNFEPLVRFVRKRLAEMRSERSAMEGVQPFARARLEMADKTAKAWPEEFARALTADRQEEDVYWVMICGWAKGTGEVRRLWYGKVFSEAAIEEKRIEFGVQPDCTLIDSGYRPKGDQGVYAACVRYGWIALKGTEEPFFWHTMPVANGPSIRVQKPWAPVTYADPHAGTEYEGRTRCPLIRFSASVMNDRLQGLLDSGLWVEPDADTPSEMDLECRRQMAAEFLRPKVINGVRQYVWVCPSGNNHARDDAKMQVLFAMHLDLLPAAIDKAKDSTE